jgi:hypothetical protein
MYLKFEKLVNKFASLLRDGKTMRAINIGLTEEQRQGVINLLNQDLADAYLLLVKTLCTSFGKNTTKS